jgi:hypothetical protein
LAFKKEDKMEKKSKQQMAKEAREGLNPIGYCGHHCNYCKYTKWCGGCRSNYSSCSFGTLFEDKICPMVKCAQMKNLNGCYECDSLENCKKGYYEKEDNNEYVCKATALFIKKYGEECYSETLKRAIDAKVKYPRKFDATGSVNEALKLLEQYIEVKP